MRPYKMRGPFSHVEAFREVAAGLHYSLLALGHDSVLISLDHCLSQWWCGGRRLIVLGPNLLSMAMLDELEALSPAHPEE